MSSSPISVLSNSLTHLKILNTLVTASANDLAEAQAAFLMPEPGHICKEVPPYARLGLMWCSGGREGERLLGRLSKGDWSEVKRNGEGSELERDEPRID